MSSIRYKKSLDLDNLRGAVIHETQDKVKKKSNWDWGVVGQATEIGFSLALPIALGALFGLCLDVKFSTRSKLMLSFLSLGIILAFTRLFQIVREYSRKKQ